MPLLALGQAHDRSAGQTPCGSDAHRPADIDEAVAEAVAKLDAEPEQVASDWTLYTLRADEVEFWQADPDRRHLRLGYERTASHEWTKELLWP